MSRPRVLILEDEFFAALDLELLVLKQAPHAEVLICSSNDQAAGAVVEPLSLAILDIDVLDGKSFPIAHSLRQRGTPIVFVSGSRAEDIPADLSDLPFIAKPYAVPVVLEALRPVLAEESSDQ